jgi:AraC family transcriptional regulator
VPAASHPEIIRRIGLAKEYIHTHYHDEIAVRQISRAAHMSCTHFIKRFKEVTGTTPYQYLMQLRIEKAKYLLLHTEESVEHITISIGLESASSFIRLFRERTAMTPLTFKRKVKYNGRH